MVEGLVTPNLTELGVKNLRRKVKREALHVGWTVPYNRGQDPRIRLSKTNSPINKTRKIYIIKF